MINLRLTTSENKAAIFILRYTQDKFAGFLLRPSLRLAQCKLAQDYGG